MQHDKFAVWGNPISHSLSPEIHTLFAAQRGQSIDYTRLGEGLDQAGFITALLEFFHQQGGKGANVTSPFKPVVYELLQSRSEAAQIAQSCNTIVKQADGTLHAENTDGFGLVTDLQDLGWLSGNSRVLILGAGGAVAGVLYNMLQEGAQVAIFNRTHQRAVELAQRFSKWGKIQAVEDYELVDFDLVINAVAYSGDNQRVALKGTTIPKHVKFYDMQYARQGLTTFNQHLHKQGVDPENYSDGLGMLVKQAAMSHYLWFGVWPSAAAVQEQLRQQLKANKA